MWIIYELHIHYAQHAAHSVTYDVCGIVTHKFGPVEGGVGGGDRVRVLHVDSPAQRDGGI